jgi:hypothetical protein
LKDDIKRYFFASTLGKLKREKKKEGMTAKNVDKEFFLS